MTVSYANATITRLRYPLINDQGTLVANFDAVPAELPIERCLLEPFESVVEVDGRVVSLTGLKGTAPTGTDLDGLRDRIRYLGVVYELAGDSQPSPSPTGALDEVVYTLRRWRYAG